MLKLVPSTAVYSLLLPEVKEILTEQIHEFYIHPANGHKLETFLKTTITTFRDWVKDIVELSEFPYAYPINGVTGGIDQWMLDNLSNISLLSGEYGWPKVQRPWIGDNTIPIKAAYISNPFSATGSFHQLHKNIELPTFLDCAFVGSTMKKKINITENVKIIAFSLSKGFGVNLFRTGFLFSKDKIPALETWLHYNYHNMVSISVARRIIDTFPVDYTYNRFRDTQLEICREYDLNPSDCVFLATSEDPKYKKYKREDGTYRLCLSREYADRGLGTFEFK